MSSVDDFKVPRTIVACTAACAFVLSACSSTGGMVKIERATDAPATAPTPAPVPTTTPPQGPRGSTSSPPPRGGTSSGPRQPVPPTPTVGSSIQPDLMCAVPQEDFDIMGAVKARFGTEAVARLTRLLATDFKNSDLTAKDRQTLKFIARETLWIPPWVERWIGDAYFQAMGSDLAPIPDGAVRQRTFAIKTLTDIVNVSPKTPFDIELMVVQSGTPSGSPGGRIFVDQQLVANALEEGKGSPRMEKLTYVFAHELAHIYKRHRAKRLQEQLISMDGAHKLVRILVNPSSATSSIQSFLETAGSVAVIVDGLRRQQADFLRAQEVEADACATALLMQSKLGDPAAGFKAYSSERISNKKTWTIYSDHPPDEQRGTVISYVVRSGQSRRPIAREDVLRSLANHIRSAARRDK